MVAVVVTYHPQPTVAEHLRAVVAEAGRAIAVDNGSGAEELAPLRAVAGVEWIEWPQNRGIAAALNAGLARAADGGAGEVVTFDQDSRPQAGFVAGLRRKAEGGGARWGVVGARIAETELAGTRHRWLRRHRWIPGCFARCPCGPEGLDNVSMVITSGSLVRVEAWRAVGGFDEGLFIDGVDTDFCLRLRAAGWSVAVAPDAVLHHRLGARRNVALPGPLGRPTFHAPVRHYYMARNRWLLLRRHWRVGHWVTFECCAAALNVARVILAEDRKAAKLRAMLRGTWDGLRGVRGPWRGKTF